MSPGPHHWFLPETPDVVALLREQLALARESFDALVAWAEGTGDGQAVSEAGHRAKEVQRRLVHTLRRAFVLPLDPEDAYAISRGIAALLRGARDLVREADVIDCAPDAALATMARHLGAALGHLDRAIAALGDGSDPAPPVDDAIATERGVEAAYRDGMAAILGDDDLHAVLARRELYRRCARMGETLVDTAERAVYADVKER